MPKISVVVPCYNASEYIVRCLDALEHQSFKNFDVFVIDDCSSDNTVEVIEEYLEKSSMNIHLLKNQTNSGPAESRKKGILESKSDFICFCDSDDWYDSTYLQEMEASQSKNESDMVFCSFRLMFKSGKIKKRLNLYNNDDLIDIRHLLIHAPDSLCLIMVSRSIILEVPHPQMRNGEDMAIIPLLVSKSKKVSAVNMCLYNYYCRKDSASSKPNMEMIKSLEASFSFIERNLSPSYQIEKEYIGIRNLLYGALINLFKFSFNRNKANQILNDFEMSFPLWNRNPYLQQLSVPKRAFLKCVYKRNWLFARLVSFIHGMLLN